MKRVFILAFLLILMLVISIVSFAIPEEKLKNNWAKGEVDEKFVERYFPHLTLEDYKSFRPNDLITKKEFTKSFSLLLGDYGYSFESEDSSENLTREELASMVGGKLLEYNIIEETVGEVPFNDIKSLPKEDKKLIRCLYGKGILKGRTRNTYNPMSKVTQIESIIVLQRVKGVLEPMKNIPFNVIGSSQSYSSTVEGVQVEDLNKTVTVNITRMFSTPGYSMEVKKVLGQIGGEYRISVSVTPPREDAILPQVITYRTISIEIDKNYLENTPYKFKVIEDPLFRQLDKNVLTK
jgi:hypothetical protein